MGMRKVKWGEAASENLVARPFLPLGYDDLD